LDANKLIDDGFNALASKGSVSAMSNSAMIAASHSEVLKVFGKELSSGMLSSVKELEKIINNTLVVGTKKNKDLVKFKAIQEKVIDVVLNNKNLTQEEASFLANVIPNVIKNNSAKDFTTKHFIDSFNKTLVAKLPEIAEHNASRTALRAGSVDAAGSKLAKVRALAKLKDMFGNSYADQAGRFTGEASSAKTKQLFAQLRTTEASKEFLSYFSTANNQRQAIWGASAIAATAYGNYDNESLAGNAARMAGFAALPLISPKLTLAAINAPGNVVSKAASTVSAGVKAFSDNVLKFSGMLQNMTKSEKAALLANPQYLGQMMSSVLAPQVDQEVLKNNQAK
jgi:hypothetical protein